MLRQAMDEWKCDQVQDGYRAEGLPNSVRDLLLREVFLPILVVTQHFSGIFGSFAVKTSRRSKSRTEFCLPGAIAASTIERNRQR